MQRWEYMSVNVLKSYGMNYRANGRKVAEWKDIPVHEMMNILGKQGFEFISYDGSNYIFKRPVAAPRPQKKMQKLSETEGETE